MTFAGRSIAEVNALPFTELVALLRPGSPSWRRRRRDPGSDRGRGADLRRPGRPHRGAARPRAWATSASGAARRPCRPVRRSACGSPPSCARGCSASSTCSTSRPPGCTRPTPSRCSTCSTGSRRPATRCSSSSTTWTSYAAPTGSSTSARARARPAGRVLYSGPVAGLEDVEESATSALPVRSRRARSSTTPRAPAGLAAPARRHPAQPARRLRRRPALRADRRHRRVRLGQVDAGHPGARRGRARHLGQAPTTGRRELEVDVDDVAGLESFDRLVLRRPAADRPHAAVQPRDVHRACSTRCASCSPPPTRPGRAATARAASPSTSPRAAARPARARGSSPSSCSSCPAPTRRARPATARATTPRRSRSPTAARTSRTCWP